MKIEYVPIGIIHSPHASRQDMPIQPAGASGIMGRVVVFPEYAAGLQDLEGFSHIVLLYHFHRSSGFQLTVVPFLDTVPRGVFATRAPRRPNPIGMSVVKLLRVAGCVLEIENVDILDGTPLLDIKPHVPEFDGQADIRTGWLEEAVQAVRRHKSDGRFADPEKNGPPGDDF